MVSMGQRIVNITISSIRIVSQNCKYFNIHENFILNPHINEQLRCLLDIFPFELTYGKHDLKKECLGIFLPFLL